MTAVLKEILDHKKQELEAARRLVPLSDLCKMVADTPPPREPLTARFATGQVNIIAEMKRASPSGGLLKDPYDPQKLARAYEEGGAMALSVLTDGRFFQGSLEDLRRVAEVSELPILRKDFTVDEYNLYEARIAGASGILLIVAALDDFQLHDYSDLAQELALSVLVEIHDPFEWERARLLGPKILGINNRNLKTLKTDLITTENLLPRVRQVATPPCLVISESGLAQKSDIVRLKDLGIDGFLIGESLLRSPDPTRLLREYLS